MEQSKTIAIKLDRNDDRYGEHKRTKDEKDKLIKAALGDFFGFGDNPPGCMAKDAVRPIDVAAEKQRFLDLIDEEAKKYDPKNISQDL